MNTVTNKLDCRCPHCLTNYDVALRHDGKTVTCNRCKQLFNIAFSIPAARRRISVPRQHTASPPVTTPFPHIQANTNFVVVASMLALIVAVAALGFAVKSGGNTAEVPNHADLVGAQTPGAAIDRSADAGATGPADS